MMKPRKSTGIDFDLRACAARVLAKVIVQPGQSLSGVLPQALQGLPEPRQRAQVQAWCYGVLRDYHRLHALLKPLLKQAFKTRDRDIEALLLIGIFQLLDDRTAAHAAISEAVTAARSLGKEWAAGLVNAILRRVQRESGELLDRLDTNNAARLAHPDWLLKRLQQDWPDQWQAIVDANNQPPPMTLRVNCRQQSRDDYLARLQAAGINAHADPAGDAAITLEKPCEVALLPGFADGAVSVQDGAAQLAAGLLDARSGDRVLDACAAPGGKTGHILELQPGLRELVALDNDSARLARVADNLERLQLSATLITGDAAHPEQWWDQHSFDRILLDAPCSATGVIRRHPDIKLLRRDEDIGTLAETQLGMLHALWPLLRPGGILLYATCSVLRRENEDTVMRFVQQQTDATALPITQDFGLPCAVGRQILPGANAGMDGFYYALLRKQA